MSQLIFNYAATTGEFVYQGIADESPLEPGAFHVPAFATAVPPPPWAGAEVACFDGVAWHVRPDWRGVPLFSIVDGSAVIINEIGIVPAIIGATDVPMPSSAHSWSGSKWVLDPKKVAAQLVAAKANGRARLLAHAAAWRETVAGQADAYELAGWANKARIADAYTAGTASVGDIEVIDTEAEKRGLGESRDDLVAKISSNALAFGRASAVIDGFVSGAVRAIEAVAAVGDVDQLLADLLEQASAEFRMLVAD